MKNNFLLEGHLAERLFNTPLLLEQGRAETMNHYLEKRMNGDLEINIEMSKHLDDEDEPKREVITRVEDVAIIPIVGSLVHRGGFIDSASGIQSYASIRQELLIAVNDPMVNKILLDIDSGGGEVEGNFDLAKLIREVNDTVKPVFAIANGSAFSGAFSLGVAAGDFFMTETGGVGSVGVIIQHVDFSDANKKAGIKVTNITAGDRKDELSSDFPLSKQALTLLQDRVDTLGNIFVEQVAEMRGISKQSVIDTQAALIFSEQAVNINFVDGIISFDDLLRELVNTDFQIETKQKGIQMFKKKVKENMEDDSATAEDEGDNVADLNLENDNEDAAEEVVKDEAEEKSKDTPDASVSVDPVKRASAIATHCAKAGVANLAAHYIESDMTIEQVKEKLNTEGTIKQACELAGKPNRAEEFIKAGTSISDVQKTLIEEASKDEPEISSSYDPESVQESLSELEKADGDLMVADAKAKREKFDKTSK